MYLQQSIKILFFAVIFSCSFQVNGQGNDSIVRAPSPYRSEYNPWFEFKTFKRGFSKDSLLLVLNDLESKDRKEWSRLDSLDFARTSLRTGKTELASYYFNNLKVDYNSESAFWWDQMMITILQKNYEAGIEEIHKSSPGILEFSKLYFLDRILLSYLQEKKTPKWYKENSILKWEVDSTILNMDKRSVAFRQKVIDPLKNLEFVLKQIIHYVHEEDPVIAKACTEMAAILETHISITQSYISYSLGRHYNKWDKEILNKIKAVKAQLTKNKYKIPIFRRYFPKVQLWEIEHAILDDAKYSFLKEEVVNERPSLMKPKKDKPLQVPFPVELILIGGLLLLFILVALFVKTKK